MRTDLLARVARIAGATVIVFASLHAIEHRLGPRIVQARARVGPLARGPITRDRVVKVVADTEVVLHDDLAGRMPSSAPAASRTRPSRRKGDEHAPGARRALGRNGYAFIERVFDDDDGGAASADRFSPVDDAARADDAATNGVPEHACASGSGFTCGALGNLYATGDVAEADRRPAPGAHAFATDRDDATR